MKTLGLIGGTTWISTAEYYKIINQRVNERLGGLTSAKMFLYSLNYEEFKPPPDITKWEPFVDLLTGIARRLEHAGADCIVICANTPHMVADAVQQNIHIAEATAKEIANRNLTKVGLLGTAFTMEQRFFKDRLSQRHIETIIPDPDDRKFVHNSIFTELAKGIFSRETKTRYLEIINKLVDRGAEGIISGCTEIPLLIQQEDCSIPLFDTTIIHANAAVDFALQDTINI